MALLSFTLEQSTRDLSTLSGKLVPSGILCIIFFTFHAVYRVCHIAGELINGLNAAHCDSPKKQIKPEDALCVQIAALCHDLGTYK